MKKYLLIIMALFISLGLSAEDDLWGDSGDDGWSDEAWSDDSFSEEESFFGGSSDGSPLSFNGLVEFPMGLNINEDTPEDSPWDLQVYSQLKLQYSNDAADLVLQIEGDYQDRQSSFEIDEAWMRLYLGRHDLEAGLMRLGWGKGDGVHVVDILHPTDYSLFIEPDYNRRKEAELMVHLNLNLGDSARAELVYVPWFTPDSHPQLGAWAQSDALMLYAMAEMALQDYASYYYQEVMTQLIAANGGIVPGIEGQAAMETAHKMEMLQNSILHGENTQQLQYAQGGFRFTHSIGVLDWGVMALRSYMREPVIQLVDLDAANWTINSNPHISLSYTPMYLIGQEAGFVLGGFNFRQEAALSLTEDWDGTDPQMRNHRVDWLFGFDRNLPLNNLNINIQGKGQYILQSDDLDFMDCDYRDEYYSHMLIANISDKYFYDKLELSVAGSMNLEDQDFFLKPQAVIHIRDTVDLTLDYRMYQGDENTLFGQFDSNDSFNVMFSMGF